MEIKLKENSTLTIKNHSGDTLCSVDEATGAVSGAGTKLYKDNITATNGDDITDMHMTVLSTRQTAFDYLSDIILSDGIVVHCFSRAGEIFYTFMTVDGNDLLLIKNDLTNISSIIFSATTFTDTVTPL